MPEYFPAINTLAVSRWTMLLCRFFGKKRVKFDGTYRITFYEWRGKLYLTNFTEA